MNSFKVWFSVARVAGMAMALTLAGCGGGGGSTPSPTPTPAPIITAFTAASDSVPAGSSTTLTAVFANGTGLIDHGVGAVTSNIPVHVSPTVDTDYILTVTGASGTAIAAQVIVRVIPSPVITSFSAAGSPITAGATTTLTAVFSGGAGTVDGGVGPVTSGIPVDVSPVTDTTYTLTVAGASGNLVKTTLVRVVASPALPVIVVPDLILAGQAATASTTAQAGCSLAWAATGAVIQGGLTGTSITFVPGPSGNVQLTCTATNEAGTASIGTAALPILQTPAFTVQPLAQVVLAGATATFTAAATGTPTPQYQWQTCVDGTTWQNIGGATGPTYAFTASPGDHGTQFRVKAQSTAGFSLSQAVPLTVNYAPLITTNPQSQIVPPGSALVLSVAAVANPSPSITWERSIDGITWTPVTGATGATYAFNAQVADDQASYRAVVTNPVGALASQAATLTVSGGLPAGTVLTHGLLSLPPSSADNPTNYLVYNDFAGVIPGADGGFDLPIKTSGTTTISATLIGGQRTLMAIAQNGSAPFVINARSTVEALTRLNPLLVVSDQAEEARMASLVSTSSQMDTLEAAFSRAFGISMDPLADPAVLEAARDTAVAVMAAAQPSAVSTPAQPMASPLQSLKPQSEAPLTGTSTIDTLNKYGNMAVLSIEESSGNTLRLKLRPGVGAFGTAINVDWVARIVELDPAKILKVGNLYQFPLLPTPPSALDPLIKPGGFDKTVIVRGASVEDQYAFMLDPLGAVWPLIADVVDPDGIPLNDGVYAIVALSGSWINRGQNTGDFESITGWQNTLRLKALTINELEAGFDITSGLINGLKVAYGEGVDNTFASDLMDTLKVGFEEALATNISQNPTSKETVVEMAGTIIPTVIEKAMEERFKNKAKPTVLKFLTGAGMTLFDYLKDSWSLGSRLGSFFLNVNPKEIGYVVVGTPTFMDNNPPSIPQGLQAARIAPNRVNLSWSGATGNVAGYNVYRNGVRLFRAHDTTSADVTVVAGQQYCYEVSAYTSFGVESGRSASTCEASATIPAGPANLAATANGNGTIALDWIDQADNESGFKIERQDEPGGEFKEIAVERALAGLGTHGTHIDGNLTRGETYSYRLRAFNLFGASGYGVAASATAVATNLSVPGAFTLGVPVVSCAQNAPTVTLTWNQATDATTYDVYRNGLLYKADATQGNSFINLANLQAGQSYTYQVMARNTKGSTPSNVVQISIPVDVCSGFIPGTPLGASPGGPVSPGPVLSSTTVPLSWIQVVGATTYNVAVRDLVSGELVVDQSTGASSTSVLLAPGRPYRWNIAATNVYGTSAYSAPLFFQTPVQVGTPVVNAISPSTMTAGSGNQSLVITGSGFATGNVVQFMWGQGSGANVWTNASSAAVVNSANQITVAMNPGTVADTIYVRVAASNGSSVVSSGAQYVTVTTAAAGTPVVTALSPSTMTAGSGNQSLVITGSGFAAGNVVQFMWGQGSGANVWTNASGGTTVNSANQITVSMNPGTVADTIYVRVAASNGSSVVSSGTQYIIVH